MKVRSIRKLQWILLGFTLNAVIWEIADKQYGVAVLQVVLMVVLTWLANWAIRKKRQSRDQPRETANQAEVFKRSVDEELMVHKRKLR